MAAAENLLHMKPIGYMKSPFKFKNGTPRQPTVCSHARGIITIEKSIFNNPDHSLQGLEQFSHVWIFFLFHKNNNAFSKAKVKPPRLNGKKVGLFSTRCPYRPNALGLTLARIDTVQGASVHVSGIDILDGTPILDLKPYISQYDCPEKWPVTSSESDGHSEGSSLSHLSTTVPKEFDQTDILSGASEILQDSKIHTGTSIGSESECTDEESEKLKLNGSMDLESSHLQSPQNVTDNNTNTHTNLRNNSSISDGRELQTHTVYQIEQEQQGSRSTELVSVKNSKTHSSVSLKTDNRVEFTKPDDLPVSLDGNYEVSSQQKLISRETDPADTSGLDPPHNSIQKERKTNDPLCKLENTVTSNIVTSSDSHNMVPVSHAVNLHSDKLSDIKGDNSTDLPSHSAQWIATPPIDRLHIEFTNKAEQQLSAFRKDSENKLYKLDFLDGPADARKAIVDILQEDPRSTYRRKNCLDSLYYFTVDILHVTCWFEEDRAEVVRIIPASKVDQCKSMFT